MSDWRDMIVGARMAVDTEFAAEVENSQFSRQQWGLIMTATSFEIENPEDPEQARIVADTSNLPAIMPELENVATMGPMGGPEGDDGGGGIFDSVRKLLGLADDGGADEEKLEEAERLVADYAEELQRHLEENGRWESVRKAAEANA